MSIQTLFALSGISLLLSAILLRVLLLFRLNKKFSYSLCALFFVVSFIHYDGYSINFYVRGLLNDLSITTLILLVYYFIQPHKDITSLRRHSYPVFFIIILCGTFFYPAALGYGPLDPYAWGYINNIHGLSGSLLFLLALFGLMLYALLRHYSLLLICLVSALLAYVFGVLESHNLWDYLFDPVIFIYALFALPLSLLLHRK